MADANDMNLMREYADHDSEAAFAKLVRRHINLVYSVAWRFTGQAMDAQDVTQAVFILLARKAASLRERVSLTGWLYETARLVARQQGRTKARQQARDQEAYMQSTLNEGPDGVWQQLAPLLEEGMSRLSENERTLLALRFFENKSAAETAALLGVQEWAAHKRLSRAVEKLRKFFAGRGVRISAAVLTALISANSLQAAPAKLAQTVVAAAMTKGVAASGSTLTLINGALKIMAWTKAKTALVVGVSLLLAAGTTTVTVKTIQKHRSYSWQVPKADFGVFYQTPPMVKIVPTKFSVNGNRCSDGGRGAMGIAQPLQEIIQVAYHKDKLRTVVIGDLPGGKYDFLAKLVPAREPGKRMPTDEHWAVALQQEIERQFGVVGRLERRETEVLVLKPGGGGLRGFKVSHHMPQGRAFIQGSGEYSFYEQPVSTLSSHLEQLFQVPIVDRTGLLEQYDYALKWKADGLQPKLEGLKQALSEQLGLELVPSREPIEMMVVEKVK